MMNDSKKAPASAATLTGAVENGPVSQTAHVSTSEHTTSPAERQPLRISDLLLHGQGNALPMRHLKELTGMDSRVIRRQIEAERRQGCPILSDNQHGYWLSDSPAEIKRFSRSMRRRAAEIRLTAMRVEGGGKRLFDIKPPDYSDAGNANRFSCHYDGLVAYTDALGWLNFNGKYWERGEHAVAERAITMTEEMLIDAMTEVRDMLHLEADAKAAVTEGVEGASEQLKKA